MITNMDWPKCTNLVLNCVLLLLLTFICSIHSSQEKPMKILTTLMH